MAEIQEKIVKVKEERRFLLKKLLEHNPELLTEELKSGNIQLTNSNSGVGIAPTRRPYKKRAKKWATGTSNDANASGADENGDVKPSLTQMLPMNLGSLNILSIGQIPTNRPLYHTENNVYPIGFASTRVYANIKEPERKCVYTCQIIDGGDEPCFQIISENDGEFSVTGPSPDLCHAALLQTMNKSSNIRNIDFRTDGDWFFGLSHPNVVSMLQAQPELTKCTNFKSFENSGISLDKETNPAINFDALQKYSTIADYHTVLEVKEEPPDELLEL